MRMMMQITIPIEAGNEAARTGAFGRSFQKMLESMNPEAAYFGAGESGERRGFVVFDMKEKSKIPAIAEPFFKAYKARVTFFPVVIAEDLAKARPGAKKRVKENSKAASQGAPVNDDLWQFDITAPDP